MFTGLIQSIGQIEIIEKKAGDLRIGIRADFSDILLGESIAIEGICLTVSAIDKSILFFDLSSETLSCTNASAWTIDGRVNLERALRVGDRLGGHFVLGHIDTRVQICEKKVLGDCLYYRFDNVSQNTKRYIIPKGSIAINGVSLTINQVEIDGFSVLLIPHTLQETTLKERSEGEWVNIEFDYLIKAVLNLE